MLSLCRLRHPRKDGSYWGCSEVVDFVLTFFDAVLVVIDACFVLGSIVLFDVDISFALVNVFLVRRDSLHYYDI